MGKYYIQYVIDDKDDEFDCISAPTVKQAIIELLKFYYRSSIRIRHVYDENLKEIPPKEVLN